MPQMEGRTVTRTVHLSHTNIKQDGRILKELAALAGVPTYALSAIGLSTEVGTVQSDNLPSADIQLLRVWTKGAQWMPRVIRHSLMMIEVTMRFWWRGVWLRPHIIHCHDVIVLPAALLIKATTRARLVYDAHELESQKRGQSAFLSKVTYVVERISWRFIDHFISVSQSILSWYEEAFGEKPMTLILNAPMIDDKGGGDPKGAYASGDYLRRIYSVPQSSLIFVYVGVLDQGRGIETILSAFGSESIESHIVFIGYGELRQRISDVAATVQKVHLHDPVTHENVVPLIRNADVGLCIIENVSLSDYFCLPNKLFEYAFAGLPVLASRFPDIERVVAKYGLGQCTDVDVNSVVAAINGIESNIPIPTTADLTDLGWEAQARKLTGAYQEIEPGARK